MVFPNQNYRVLPLQIILPKNLGIRKVKTANLYILHKYNIYLLLPPSLLFT